ncbi:AAA family ATPase [Polymorphobacter fuscus]|uniref:non-specific protein-tyrosine kinase n=2 Tax=Sandarakinorhabdus fusca TaxID=1439888 RepID=A0A7C9GPX4_9SPHN|nr:polysaccharide biosynthesis tyrosine autokinase [Polymorphobacter fuscus]MQT17236.1 AAA family ATPase [Polymorphobacter fuscus]
MHDGFNAGQGKAVPFGTSDAGADSSRLFPDLRVLWAIFRRRIWVFLLVAAIIIAAVATYIALAPKHYSATASVLIEPRGADPIQQTNSPSTEVLPSSDYIDTQIVVIDSPRMAASVVTALGLTDDPEFSGGLPPANGTSAEQAQARLVASAEALRRAVVVRRAGRTSVVEIAATSQSATQAARIANAFAKAYLDSIRAAKDSADKLSTVQINSRLAELRVDAERADAALQQYKIANGLMSAQGATTAEQETSVLNQQLAGAKATLAERRGRLAAARRQLEHGGGGGDVATALNSGTIGALRAQEADSSRNMAQLRARYGSRHPSIAQEEERLTSIQRQIQLEIDRILSSLQAEVQVAASGVESLLASQRASQAKLAGNAAAQVGYLELDRKAIAARAIYQAFLNKSIGAAARAGIDQPRASIASPALIPIVPSAPNVRLLAAMGAVFALVFGLMAVALAEFVDGGIRTKQDVERRLGARYLGAVPDLGSTLPNLRQLDAAQDYIVSHPQSIFAEALRGLRASLTLRGRRRPKIIAVVSALPREGKTTTAICLARTLALSGASTVLVDCDVRRHSASDILLGDRPGLLLDVIAGDASLDSALVKDRDTDLVILGVSSDSQDPRDLLATDALGDLLAALRARFEYVVMDTPPVIGLADARIVAAHADTVMLLARWQKTSLRTVDTALDMLIAADAKVAGVALTLVDIRKYASTGHEDIYSYYGKFKGYYTN